MSVRLKARTTKGFLMIYEDKVSIELKALGHHTANTLQKEQITGIEIKTTMAPMPILYAGAATVTIHGTGNQTLKAPFVKLPEAKKAEELVLAMISHKSTSSSSSSADVHKASST